MSRNAVVFDRAYLKQYVGNLVNALRTANARAFYFPPNRARRRSANERLGREVGYGFADFEDKDVDDVLGGTYSQLVVLHSLDTTGVALDAKDWVAAIHEGIAKGRAYDGLHTA